MCCARFSIPVSHSKMLAYGFALNRDAYMRDPWCQLDFLVVTLAWLPILFPSMGNYSTLRAFRALRPLRALNRVPGMPVLMQSIALVIPKLGSILGLCGFLVLVFGIVGMELFKGSLHYRCAIGRDAAADTGIMCNPTLAATASMERYLAQSAGCKADGLAVCPGFCPAGSLCTFFDSNPRPLASFDSAGLAALSIIETITLDAWSDSMYALMESFSPHTWAFFLVIVVLGGFFIVNL